MTFNTCFGVVEYAKRCNISFMRECAKSFIKTGAFQDITDNCTIYCWSNYLNSLFNFLKTTNFKNITLLSGDNDHSVNSNGCISVFPNDGNVTDYVQGPPKNIARWFAQNTQVVNDFIKPLPIGLRPPWVETNISNFEGIQKNIVNCEREFLVYSNFNIATNPVQRTEIKNIIKNNLNVKTEFDSPDYCKNLQTHKFVICPPGNGKDTNRTWESLYFGAIPIVEDNPMNRYFSNYFPILVMDRWVDINEQFLNEKYEELKCKFVNSHFLDVDVWFKSHNIL